MTARDAGAYRRRRTLLALTEPARTLASAGAFAAGLPLFAAAPRGESHPVLVLPGLMASDVSTRVLRGWVSRLGYPTVGWALGRNRGPSDEVDTQLPILVDRLATEHGAPVSIVGWSLGGIFARRLALRVPAQVRQVISLGSPFALAGFRGSLARPLPVPSTAVYSRWDGVVDWQQCRQRPGPRSENVAVRSSHLGMGHDPAVLWVVADRLAQPKEHWQPFQRPTRFGLGALFPAEDRPPLRRRRHPAPNAGAGPPQPPPPRSTH